MLREVVQHLELEPGLVVLDGTVGGGGHSRKILDEIGPAGRLIGLDRDASMLVKAQTVLQNPNVILVHQSYADARSVLDQLGLDRVDRILVDLGLSSDQLADQSRGFSFESAGPLDMRFDATNGQPAWQLLADWDEAFITSVLDEFGEEPHSRRIAAAIVEHRAKEPIRTARDLAKVVRRVVGSKGPRDRDPATRTFQALRIAVNRELEQLTEALHDTFPLCLKSGGLLAVISFHSLEDRLVKEAFRERVTWAELTPKPIEPTPAEVRFNPRSRSAKLRIARRAGAP